MKRRVMVSRSILERMENFGQQADAEACWPEESWKVLIESGALRWIIPESVGGVEKSYPELLEGYAELASGCLVTTFLLSQRDAACRRLRDSANQELAQELLPPLARGETFSTVGLAQLTTSRQHGKPAMTIEAQQGNYVLNGIMPWVTGADHADFLVTGGVLESGQQLMLIVQREAPGLTVEPALDLMALQGTLTTSVHCENVKVDSRFVLAGPTEKVMTAGRSGPGGLETSCLALGLCRAALRHLKSEAENRPEWEGPAAHFQKQYDRLWNQLMSYAREGCSAQDVIPMRAECNELVLHLTQTALTASKGTGFLRSHPAQRWARQALFFLVWACPRPAVDAMLASMMPCE